MDQWLCRYKLRAKVDIADVSSEYTTWARFGPGLMPQGKLLHCRQAMFCPTTGTTPCRMTLSHINSQNHLLARSMGSCTAHQVVPRRKVFAAVTLQASGAATQGCNPWVRGYCCRHRTSLPRLKASRRQKESNTSPGV